MLSGHVRLHFADRRVWVGEAGEYVTIPQVRHDLSALEDAVVLLTTTVRRHPADTAGPDPTA